MTDHSTQHFIENKDSSLKLVLHTVSGDTAFSNLVLFT